jgi:hypothetical protein
MQIKRLLDDRVVVTGDKLINSQGEHCEFVEHADGQLVAVSPDGKKVRNSPAEFGCYLFWYTKTNCNLRPYLVKYHNPTKTPLFLYATSLINVA